MYKMFVRRAQLILVVLLAFLFSSGCAALLPGGEGTISWNDMTPKQKATMMMGAYNTLYDNYKFQVAQPNLTEEQKGILKGKKEILTNVWPLIALYDSTVSVGNVPPAELEVQILNMIDQLGVYLGTL